MTLGPGGVLKRFRECTPLGRITASCFCLHEFHEALLAKGIDYANAHYRKFEQAAEQVQLRAGSLLAQRVRECVAVLRQDVLKDVGNASSQARERIEAVVRPKYRPTVQRWVVIGLLSGTVLFGCGVWLGTLLR